MCKWTVISKLHDVSVEKEKSFGRFGQRRRLDGDVGTVAQFLLKFIVPASHCERADFAGAPGLQWPIRNAIGWRNLTEFWSWTETLWCFSCLPPGCDNGSILRPILASVGRNILGLPSLQPLIYLHTVGIQNNQNNRPPGKRSWWQSVRDPSIIYLIIIH